MKKTQGWLGTERGILYGREGAGYENENENGNGDGNGNGNGYGTEVCLAGATLSPARIDPAARSATSCRANS